MKFVIHLPCLNTFCTKMEMIVEKKLYEFIDVAKIFGNKANENLV